MRQPPLGCSREVPQAIAGIDEDKAVGQLDQQAMGADVGVKAACPAVVDGTTDRPMLATVEVVNAHFLPRERAGSADPRNMS